MSPSKDLVYRGTCIRSSSLRDTSRFISKMSNQVRLPWSALFQFLVIALMFCTYGKESNGIVLPEPTMESEETLRDRKKPEGIPRIETETGTAFNRERLQESMPKNTLESEEMKGGLVLLSSENGKYKLLGTSNLGLSLYKESDNSFAYLLWNSETDWYFPGYQKLTIKMLENNNLVAMEENDEYHPSWETSTTGCGELRGKAVLQNDGNFVVMDGRGVILWETSTSGGMGSDYPKGKLNPICSSDHMEETEETRNTEGSEETDYTAGLDPADYDFMINR